MYVLYIYVIHMYVYAYVSHPSKALGWRSETPSGAGAVTNRGRGCVGNGRVHVRALSHWYMYVIHMYV